MLSSLFNRLGVGGPAAEKNTSHGELQDLGSPPPAGTFTTTAEIFSTASTSVPGDNYDISKSASDPHVTAPTGAHRHPSGRAGHQANYEDTPQIIDAPGSSTTGSKVPPTRRHKRKGARQRTGTEDVNSTELRTAEIAAHHAKMREMQEKFIEEDNQRILKALAELDELLDFETVLPLFEAAFLTATDEKGDAENEIITTYKTNEDIIFAIFDIQEQAQKLRRQLMISYRKNLDILLRLAEES